MFPAIYPLVDHFYFIFGLIPIIVAGLLLGFWAAIFTVVAISFTHFGLLAGPLGFSLEQAVVESIPFITLIIGGTIGYLRDLRVKLSHQREKLKRSEKQLRQFKMAADQSGHAIYITDSEGTIEYVNPTYEAQTGYFEAEAVGKTPNILNSGVHDDELFADLWETIQGGEVWSHELVNKRADGTEYYVDQTIAPLETEDGDIDAFVAVNRDITDRKEYEQQLEEHRDSLAVLNQVLRHDIRNNLQVVTGYGEFLADHVDDEGQEYLQTMLDNANHAVELTMAARDMAEAMHSAEETEIQRIDLRAVIESELDNVRSAYPEAEVTMADSVPVADVMADDMLDSVLRNLLKNAIQHNDADEPVVSVSATDHGDTVQVCVADNGPGIPDDLKDDIFGKGESGLESGGTGIGLYLVRTLVENYDGDVWVEDNEPEGSVFVVELNRANEPGSS